MPAVFFTQQSNQSGSLRPALAPTSVRPDVREEAILIFSLLKLTEVPAHLGVAGDGHGPTVKQGNGDCDGLDEEGEDLVFEVLGVLD